MTDVKIINDEFGRPHPVKVEDLFQYGLEADGDSIATGIMKSKHIIIHQHKDDNNVGVPYALIKDITLPEGARLFWALRSGVNDSPWTVNGELTSAYFSAGTPDNPTGLFLTWDIAEEDSTTWLDSLPGAVANSGTYRVTIYAPAESSAYAGGSTSFALYYSVPTDVIVSDSPEWVID